MTGWRLAAVFVFTALIYGIEELAHAARLAGVRTRRPAQANSVYNLVALSSRAAFVLQAVLLAGLVDRAAQTQSIDELTWILRWVLMAAAAGIIAGALLVPSVSRLLGRAAQSYALRRSLPRVVLHGLSVRGLPQAWKSLRPPQAGALIWAGRQRLPWLWILAGLGVATLRSVAGPAAQIASALTPQGARTALTLPSFLTGIGTVLMVLLVDPLSAHICDQALRGERPLTDVTRVTIWQIAIQLVGALLAQLVLAPTAGLLAALTAWLV